MESHRQRLHQGQFRQGQFFRGIHICVGHGDVARHASWSAHAHGFVVLTSIPTPLSAGDAGATI